MLAALVVAAFVQSDCFAANESLASDAGVEAGIFLLLFTFFFSSFVDASTFLPASELAVDTEPALGPAGSTFFLAALFLPYSYKTCSESTRLVQKHAKDEMDEIINDERSRLSKIESELQSHLSIGTSLHTKLSRKRESTKRSREEFTSALTEFENAKRIRLENDTLLNDIISHVSDDTATD